MQLPPTVCLDGGAVRRIREEKHLTQLYVAKVVGVTTDTISRWENNRYPTVRRENLVKLGEALEVPVEELLSSDSVCAMAEGDVAEGAAAEVSTARGPFESRWLWLALAGAVLLALAFFYLYRFADGAARPARVSDFSTMRLLPHYAAPGTVIPVRLRLSIDETRRRYIVREHFPAGWELIEASPPASSIDNESGMARWIVKQGDEQVSIVYLVRVDPRSPSRMIGRFHGEIVGSLEEKNLAAAIDGDAEVVVAPYSWADLDGDSQIDDTEMLEASLTFDELSGVHLDWKELEDLWDAGHYRFDASRNSFVPARTE